MEEEIEKAYRSGYEAGQKDAFRHAYWIEFGFVNAFKCSDCGRIIYRKEPYCNCGCKMDATPDD